MFSETSGIAPRTIIFLAVTGILVFTISSGIWQYEIIQQPVGDIQQAFRRRFVNSSGPVSALESRKPGVLVTVGGGITSRKWTPQMLDNIETRYHLFTHFLPSFCQTVFNETFEYHFYFGYDADDQYFNDQNTVSKFRNAFTMTVSKSCHEGLVVDLTLVKCSHTVKPAWAQNDAMMVAYLDGMEYFYRINDDTRFETKGWTEMFIKALDRYQPPRVGVVGPTHDWGNTLILTYDFVHRSHVDIFGFYYPRTFTDWYSDGWITEVYQPDRMLKLPEVKLKHSNELGTRYNPNMNLHGMLPTVIESCKVWLNYFIKSVSSGIYNGSYDKLIVMSITELTAAHVYGAIRNAQLVPVFYPDGWTLRVYIPLCNSDINMDSVKRTLQRLRAEVVFETCSTDSASAYINTFRSLTETAYTHVIERSPLFRFSDREAQAVEDWIKFKTSFHIIRDHPSHMNLSVVPQLWGMRSHDFQRNILKKRLIADFLSEVSSNTSVSESNVLSKFILPLVSHSIFESSANKTLNATITSSSAECSMSKYIGQSFNEYMIPL